MAPTIGRIVHFYPAEHAAKSGDFTCHGKGPLAAIITHVHSPRCVNLAVFDSNGGNFGITSVYLAQIGEPFPFQLGDQNLATWPPREPSGTAAAPDDSMKRIKQVAAAAPPLIAAGNIGLTQTPAANIDPGHGEASAPQVTTPEFSSPDGA